MVSDLQKKSLRMKSAVLILVVMEYGLRQHSHQLKRQKKPSVLILVVMEYGLRHEVKTFHNVISLNPCCNGILSQTCLMQFVVLKYLI